MAKYKDLLVSTKIVYAGRKRKCYHSAKHKIQKGDVCVEVKDGMRLKGYCSDCAKAMLNQASLSAQEVVRKLQDENT